MYRLGLHHDIISRDSISLSWIMHHYNFISCLDAKCGPVIGYLFVIIIVLGMSI